MISAERLGLLFTLVGPGGVGKNALLNKVVARVDNLRQLPTATTRPIRPGEQQGREHIFVSVDEFQRMIDAGELLEHQEVHPGKFYGVPRTTVDQAIAAREDLIADIEMYGAAIIRQAYPQNSLAIFIAPPSVESLLERLQTRNASPEDVQDRVNRLPLEMQFAPQCDYVIVNDDVEVATDELQHVILGTRGQHTESPLGASICFNASVTVLWDDEILCGDDAQSFTVPIKQGEQIENVIRHYMKGTGLNNNATLLYESPLDELPLSITWDDDTYTLTYHYSYRLPERVNPPQGWQWYKRDKVFS